MRTVELKAERLQYHTFCSSGKQYALVEAIADC